MSRKSPEDTPIRAEIERRRLAAERLLRAGATQTQVATELKVSQASVSRWARKFFPKAKRKRTPKPTGGNLILARLKTSRENPKQGPPPFLTLDQLREVWKAKDTWTGREFSEVIFDAFGVQYSISHSCELLNRLKAAALTKGGR